MAAPNSKGSFPPGDRGTYILCKRWLRAIAAADLGSDVKLVGKTVDRAQPIAQVARGRKAIGNCQFHIGNTRSAIAGLNLNAPGDRPLELTVKVKLPSPA
ncbi:MAG: hypothetical protein HC925_05245 [Coleofasciculaceae cyanobacterium SM2_3_26]|nr:hypothetical protein [Coleofasciculaceae cyanobacterium SM2_3_26]